MDKAKRAKYDRLLPYNDLPDLAPDEAVFDSAVLLRWGLASRALAELNKNILRLPNPNMLINTISLQEAKSSSAIENIFTTEDELYKAVSDTVKDEHANAPTKEVLRYREALWAGYEKIIKKKIIDKATIIKIFQQVKNIKHGIRPPQSQVVIKRGQSELRPGEIIYTPPSGKRIVENKLRNLLQYLNDDKKYPTDPLMKMAIAHYQFEAIHPCMDGNGRTGRIINLLYLVNKKLLSHPVLYLSKYIINTKDDYYRLLAGVTQRHAWKPWLIYMLTGIEKTAVHTNQLIDAIIDQMEATLKHGKTEFKWYTKEINETLFTQPYIKARVIGKISGVTSRTTLTKYMSGLSEAGILTSKQSGNEVFYINNDLVRILED